MEALYAEPDKRVEAAMNSYSVTGYFLHLSHACD